MVKINEDITNTVIVSSTEPIGDNKKKVWLKHSYNIFDNILETGTISSATGQNSDAATRKRSKNYIEVKPNTAYTLSFNTFDNTLVFEYASDKSFIGCLPAADTWTTTPYSFTTSSTTKYIRFISYTTNTTKAKLEESSTLVLDKHYILNNSNTYEEFNPYIKYRYSLNNYRSDVQTITRNDIYTCKQYP